MSGHRRRRPAHRELRRGSINEMMLLNLYCKAEKLEFDGTKVTGRVESVQRCYVESCLCISSHECAMNFAIHLESLLNMIAQLQGKAAGYSAPTGYLRLSACDGMVFVAANEVVCGVEALVLKDGACSITMYYNVSQDMFGDLTTITLGYRRGWDQIYRDIKQNGEIINDPTFHERADHRGYSFALSQILTRNLIGNFNYELLTDQGYLQNPYRQIRYSSPGVGRGLYAREPGLPGHPHQQRSLHLA